jgi:gamma-glutamyl hercynylcysteine S-oxide synthase
MHQLSHTALMDVGANARHFNRAETAAQLVRLRAFLRDFVARLGDAQIVPPVLATINPPMWEAAHVAWFAEWWCVRGAYNTPGGGTRADRDSAWVDCDGFLDSNKIAHDERWQLPQLTRLSALDYLDRSLALTLAALQRADETDAGLYPFRLSMFHEAMHLEALAWAAQTLGWVRPAWVRVVQDTRQSGETMVAAARPSGEAMVAAARPSVGQRDAGFSFDNERDAHEVSLAQFAIDRAPISNAQFLQFVESGEYFSGTGQLHPNCWRNLSGDWQVRSFDSWLPLNLRAPVIHVSAMAAHAYCQWAGRRLPTEHEWAVAAARGAIEWGDSVWEWTASTFAPYPGFVADRYREYSAPWFDGKHHVLRGGSHATLDIMHHARYRNYFLPQRSDVFAGFRTCNL